MLPKPILNIAHTLLQAGTRWGLIGALLFHWTTVRAQIPFTCEDQFFLTLTANPPSLNEVLIDPQTSDVVFQTINSNLSIAVNAAGYRSVDNFIYSIDPITRDLVRLDAVGNAQVLANLQLSPLLSYFAGDVSPDGRYLVIIGTINFTSGFSSAAELVKIDLEDPNFGTSTQQLTTTALIFDIAFHPETEELYGYDSNGQRVVRIDLDNGAITFPFAPAGVPVLTGSLFFDAYGDLFAYGSPNAMSDQNSLYKIDLQTGQSTFLTAGAPAPSSDGCSCPYTIELSKSVEPLQALPCTDVEYSFEIVNSSRRPHQGIKFKDVLPPGFTFVSVKANPVGGIVRSVPGDNSFEIDSIALPAGRSVITIVVNTGQVAPGVYRNQAILSNLPAALGGSRVSDNLRTLVRDDSTELRIVAFPFDTLSMPKTLCEGSGPLRIDGTPFANLVGFEVDFLWPDGSTESYFDVTTPGEYRLLVASGCDTGFVYFNVGSSTLMVDVVIDSFGIQLGDSVLLQSQVLNTADQTNYSWLDPQGGSLSCPTCADTWARPFNDLQYTVIANNELGCRDSAFVRVTVQKNRSVYFPNVFMPTSDNERNAFFFGSSADPYVNVKTLAVFSRWGEKMFETRNSTLNDPQAGWDGTFRGEPMQPGVYVWVAKLVTLDGVESTYSGDVTLIR